jgi:hypothetical protein
MPRLEGTVDTLEAKWICFGSGGIRTHASEETGALNQRLRPLGHATLLLTGSQKPEKEGLQGLMRQFVEDGISGHFQCLRPYHVENTSSRPITEVKQHRAELVLGWVTAWEYSVL